jgi:predicted nucleotide-binding protein
MAENPEYWHVRIQARNVQPGSEILAVDKTRDWIEERILKPRRRGAPVAIQGRNLPWEDIQYVWIGVSEVPTSDLIPQVKAERERRRQYSGVVVLGGTSDRWGAVARTKDMTDELIDGPVGSEIDEPTQVPRADPRKVMVVHGRDDEARRAMFDFLRALGLDPREWSSLVAETGSAAPYIGQVLTKAFETAKAVVVLFTPDDEGWLKEAFRQPDDPPEETQPTPQARPNVLFEAGMALGVQPDRTVLVELGKLRSFSDIYGRHVIRLDGTEKQLREIARRLKNAGCEIAENNDEWATTRFPER